MNFALLGDDVAIGPLLDLLRRSPRHRLTAASLSGALTSAVETRFPAARRTDQWEQLLVDQNVDAVIVAGASDAVLDAARRLASEGRALLFWPHGGQTAFVYELSLVRDDARAALAPLLPNRFERIVPEVRQRIQSGEFGTLMHLQWERRVPCLSDAPVPLLAPEDMEQYLIGDADLLRSLGGNYDRVTALATGLVAGNAASVAVTLAGEGLPDATWTLRSIRPSASETTVPRLTGDWTLTVTGTRGQASFESAASDVDVDRWFDRLAETIEGRPPEPGWNELLRACETVDAARRSLKRRRTIDLHFETASERSQFKTQMTAIGCGVLFLTLALTLLLMLIGSVVDVPPGIMRVARVLIFAPLFIFLALQLLIVVARPSSDDS